jgi:hypothetical protein
MLFWLTQEEIDRLNNAAFTIRMVCTDDVRTGLYWVKCRTLKELLAKAAEGLVTKLLDYVRMSARSSNIKVNEEYTVMTSEVGKVSSSGEQVLALKKYIAKCNQDQERLRDTIHHNKEKDEFLMSHR